MPPARFERAAYGLGIRCSILLSYGGAVNKYIFLLYACQSQLVITALLSSCCFIYFYYFFIVYLYGTCHKFNICKFNVNF